MDVTVRMPAEPDARYAEGCLDASVGRNTVVRLAIGGRVTGTLTGYRVLDDGASLELTIDLPADATSIFTPSHDTPGYSIGHTLP